MNKLATFMRLTVLLVSSLAMVCYIFAQTTTKLPVPEFIVKEVATPYDVPITYSIDLTQDRH